MLVHNILQYRKHLDTDTVNFQASYVGWYTTCKIDYVNLGINDQSETFIDAREQLNLGS